MIRNFYMSPYYFFGFRQLSMDMEAQNFFLADPLKDNVDSTIKIYPSLNIQSDLPMEFRDAHPEYLKITALKTGFLSSLQFFGA